ncbi:2-keto-3-deoxy-galactonokinase [Litchfieldella qijiaojingensis]|uniref:2-keto-3-deoxy-galactonokinase n=1 Tax=Litchfieldella qijiaojingensis TaxID=980347 RepID=A0ABQ2YZF6_9GAMM|nr:2-dehydro-3-deoxygalactonokinase [Halomonas qijiaojingensis]GGY00410.1 2-keto-3-deoxy-galactonokinase [Halomonas qijiaojingensis]
MTTRKRLAWIAVDWGSSNLRVWAMSDADEVLAHRGTERGMLGLSSTQYEATLLDVLGDWLPENDPLDVIVCGMAGARQGWREAPYLVVPARLDTLAEGAVVPSVQDPRLQVRLLPGLCQHRDETGKEFDVMRGEETQLAGLVAREPEFSGRVCLPGTHAKWARLVVGELLGFQTFMSGELFRLLAQQSVLSHSLSEDDLADSACREAFVTAVQDVSTEPTRFTQRLFAIRAGDLLDERLPGGEARGACLAARLSGLVIGLELAGALGGLDESEQVCLIGAEALCHRYALALEALGYTSRVIDNERAVLAGLALARSTVKHE